MSYNYKVKFTTNKQLSTLLPAITSALKSSNHLNEEQISNLKCAIYEAINNVEIHAYPDKEEKPIEIELVFRNSDVRVTVSDKGIGIKNVEKASEPMFTTFPSMYAGMGINIMKCYSDKVSIKSTVGKGTKVTIMQKI